MATDHIDVGYVAKLARISLTDEETSEFQGQLEGILDYIDTLKQVDVEGISPEKDLPLGPMREDQVQPGLNQDDFVMNAPESAQGQVRVPKVVDPT